MKIVLVLKDNLNRRAPILSTVCHLIELGHELTLIVTGIAAETRQKFEAGNCKCITVDIDTVFSSVPKIGKMAAWHSFRKKVFHILSEESFDILWIASADAALALGEKLFDYPYIIQVQELYDTVPYYRRRLGDYMRHAKKVFVPEEVRAHIFRAWYQLKETPVVFPNKPYEHPRKRNLPIADPAAAKAVSDIPGDAKVVLYQGWIGKGRNIEPIAKAIEELGTPWVFAIQAPEETCDFYKNIFKKYKICKIPYVPAPNHLEVTSHADIGVVSYFHNHLNNEFCAPNKIWEYTGFGIPLIGNDVEGLLSTAGKYQAGHFLNFDNIGTDEIKKCLQDLLEKQDFFISNALKFYDSVDNKRILTEALNSLVEF